MAQHDMVVDNGPGLAVRTDINGAIAALVSSNSGPVEPTVKVAGQMWFDTTGGGTGRLKVRNVDNTLWTDLLGAAGNFNVGLTLTGLEAAGVSKAYVGFVETDIGFGVRKAGTPAGSPTRFVWNDRADLTGTDGMQLSETSVLSLTSAVLPAGVSNGTLYAPHTVSATYLVFNGWAIDGVWKVQEAGYGVYFYQTKSTGTISISRTSASRAAGADFGTMIGCLNIDAGSTPNIKALNGAFIGYAGLWANSALTFGLYETAAVKGVHFQTGYYIGYVKVSGDLQWIAASATSMVFRKSDNALINYGPAYKPGGGSWADSSDARIKTVAGDYEKGLAEVIALRPVRYTYKGNDTPNESGESTIETASAVEVPESAPYPSSPHYAQAVNSQEFIGLIAQEVEPHLPSMVSYTETYIDRQKVTDMRVLDTTALIYAVVNAIKELNTRLVALEGGTA